MLLRDNAESERLNSQHEFMRDLGHGHLIHPSVKTANIRAIADVGTGTGIWLRATAQQLAESRPNGEPVECVGFDISPQQFPAQNPPNLEFVVHDIVNPFPQEYQEKFDLVHIRLLSYAIKAKDLESAVKNAVSIIRPGGFLQWEELDIIDYWATPETDRTRSAIHHIYSERVARGLCPAIATPLVKMIQSLTLPLPEGKFSPLTWTEDIMRIINLETITTINHEAPRVHAMKRDAISLGSIALLGTALSRRATGAADPTRSVSEVRQLESEGAQIKEILEAIKQGQDPASSTWDMDMTRIIARKVAVADSKGEWMSLRK